MCESTLKFQIRLPLSFPTLLLVLGIAFGGAGSGQQASLHYNHYKELPLFAPNPRPDSSKPWNIKNFGPVGIGIDLTKPGFTMVIQNVEEGSPAAKTGKLKKGLIIESINGQTLKERDPRIILGDIITEAEAADGKIRLKIRGEGEVVVTIPAVGSYANTWPVDCGKSDKIVRGLADVLAKLKKPSWGSTIFLLSTGEEKDLEVVRRWMGSLQNLGSINWQRGYTGIGVCEYYLRTGDDRVLPVIRKAVKELEERMYNGGWSSRDHPASFTYSTGSGQLHAAGVHCMTFLLMAKLCGVEVDERTLMDTLAQFYRFAGHGNVAYGDTFPEGGFVDNGKHSGLAVAMQAATLLTPEGEKSVYSRARDNSAMKAFYATNWFHAAHTGGGLGEIWHHAAMNIVREKRPVQYRSYFDTRRWVMELSRRHDGGIGIAGMTDRYDAGITDMSKDGIDYGTFFALTYTLHRKQLQLFGAPRSKWAKTSPLPERPWGNAADDIFLSNDPIPGSSLTIDDLLKETVPTHSSYPAFIRMQQPSPGIEVLMGYLHHPEFDLRVTAINYLVGKGRHDLVVPLLKSKDARLRHSGILAIKGMFKGKPISDESITPEMWNLIGAMIENPEESWWNTSDAIFALCRADIPTIARHKDRLVDLLRNRNCTWTKAAAMAVLAKTCSDAALCKEVLPILMDATATVWNDAASYRFTADLKNALGKANPETKAFAASLLKQGYEKFPPKLVAPGGAVLGGASTNIKIRIGSVIKELPDGLDFIRTLPMRTRESVLNGDESDYFVYSGFKRDPRFVGRWKKVGKLYALPPAEKDLRYILKTYREKEEKAITQPKKGRGAFRQYYLTLGNDGSAGKSRSTFWTGDFHVVSEVGEARRMKVFEMLGEKFLLIEEGGFPTEQTPDWKCGWVLYILSSPTDEPKK